MTLKVHHYNDEHLIINDDYILNDGHYIITIVTFDISKLLEASKGHYYNDVVIIVNYNIHTRVLQ